jgi:hypothetical protein
MTTRKLLSLSLTLTAMVAFGAGYARRALAEKPAASAGAGGAGGATPTNCKAFGGGKCCDPAVMEHLTKAAVFKACGESDATYLGEVGSKETCKYVFKVEGEKPEDTFVQVYVPAQKEVPSTPNDPFFAWKKVGKAYLTEKAKSPKAAPMLASATGLWLPGKGYFVSVNASTKICSKAEAAKLAPAIK